MNNKFAFTMAEVLITLGIIGIVAAMTLPTLMSKYDEIVMINKLKRTYSELANAIELRKAELGTSDYAEQFNPSYTASEQLDGFLKNLNVIERCHADNPKGCGGNYKTRPKRKTNDGYGNIKEYNMSTGSAERAILNDGTLVWMGKRDWSGNCEVTYIKFETDANGNFTNIVDGKPVPIPYQAQHCAEIFFDINAEKGLNQFGYDCFSFGVTPTKLDQHSGYGGLYDTMRTGKLDYDKYSSGKY